MHPPRMLRGILTGILTGALALSVLPDADTPLSDVIVRGTDLEAVAAAVAEHGGTVELELGIIDGVAADVPTALLDALAADARTTDISPDAQVALLSTDLPEVHRGLTPEEALHRVGGRKLDRRDFDGTGIDVAVVDSGIDIDALPGSNIVRGVNVSFDETDGDGYGHGTAMAGIIAGDTAAYEGTASDARLIDVKVADARGVADISQVLAGIDWVVSNRDTDGRNIRVLSLSFGTNGTNDAATSPLVYAAEAAWRHGITVVVAAGNHGDALGRLSTPAISQNLLVVGAADISDVDDRSELRRARVPDWSAVGDAERGPDLLAPGRSLLGGLAPDSTIARNHPEAREGDYLLGSGTSQATAFTAGVVASMLERNPNMQPDRVKAMLVGNATKVRGDERQTGAGVMNIARMMSQDGRERGREAVVRKHDWSDGSGSLDADRGSFFLENADGARLQGENTVLGAFDRDAWQKSTWTGSTWTGSTWTGSTWTGSTWTGSTWTGSTWTRSTWTRSTWTNVRWGE